jgi:hypothetical protein
MDPTNREQIMKRTAIVLGVAAAMLVAPSVASGGVSAQVRPEVATVEAQHKPQVIKAEVVKAHVVAHVVTVERHRAYRISLLNPLSR